MTMTMFKKEQYENLTAEAKTILKNLGEGMSVRDVMARIYVDNLEDKTLKQGELMADGILQNVKSFDTGYQAAQEDLDRCIEEFGQKVIEGKSPVERCNYWLKLAAAVSAADGALETGADRESLLRELEGLEISEEEATAQREEELRAAAIEAIRGSGVLLAPLLSQDATLEELDDAIDAAGLLIDLGNQEIEYRAVVSMLAYTKIKNGTFDGMPADITAEQVTAMVCASVEQTRILEAVGKGDMAVDVATGLLFLLGAYLLLVLAVSAAVGGILIAREFLNILFLIPAILMIVGGMMWAFEKAADAWLAECRIVTKPVVAAVRFIWKGAAAVAGFIRSTVLPKVIKTARDIREKLAGLRGTTRMVTVETTAE